MGLEISFRGQGAEEKGFITGIDEKIFTTAVGKECLTVVQELQREKKNIIEVDPQYFRPTEVDFLQGDPEKAKRVLGWEPEYDLQGLVADMMKSDLLLMKKDSYLKEGGYFIKKYFD